ncbi:MAG: hypothetical protein SVV80_13105 [Planctomycetota bacterium]|nr:hypothetical protein [Planctomycetota bacterium]
MTLGIRKFVVILLVGSIFLLGNIWLVVNWLDDKGVIDGAKYVRKEYLTGTAITIVIVLLILLVKPGREAVGRFGLTRRCPVCDHRLLGRGQYCGECGSKV